MSYLRHIRNMRYALAGIARILRGEKTFHMLLVASIALTVVSLLLGTPLWRLSIIVFGFILVLSLELLNTAIEVSGDKHDDQNPIWLQGRDEKIRDMKDIAAGAIFLISVGALLLWAGLTFLP